MILHVGEESYMYTVYAAQVYSQCVYIVQY